MGRVLLRLLVGRLRWCGRGQRRHAGSEASPGPVGTVDPQGLGWGIWGRTRGKRAAGNRAGL
eukprot:scaffold234526_cov13-Tisochrysis_lutea.AAC.1